MKHKPKLTARSGMLYTCLSFIILFTACEKKDVEPILTKSNLNTDETLLLQEGINIKLSLRPQPQNGQDVYVDKEVGVTSTNVNNVPELCASAWTINGNLYGAGFYIRFDSLKLIPSNAHVLSARLFLYGLSNSLSTPQGNQGDNKCYVERVTSPWQETTLTYTNRPSSTTENRSILVASTSQWNYNAIVDVTSMASYFIVHSAENYGFYIHQVTQTPYRSLVFGSSEQADRNLRPKLVITYQ